MDLLVFDICEAYDCQVADEISFILQPGNFFRKVGDRHGTQILSPVWHGIDDRTFRMEGQGLLSAMPLLRMARNSYFRA